MAILSSLATPEQSTDIMDLAEALWEEPVGEMPLKIAYSALESHDWRIVKIFDPKNAQWSYLNGGSWPDLSLPLFTLLPSSVSETPKNTFFTFSNRLVWLLHEESHQDMKFSFWMVPLATMMM